MDMLRQLGSYGSRGLVLVLLLHVMAGCGGSFTPAPYTNEEGNYRVLAVGRIKSSQQTLASQAGELTVFAMESIDGNKTSRSVTYTDYPAQVMRSRRPEAMLDGFERAMTPGGQWSIESQKSILLDGHPGREVQFSVSVPNNPEKGAGRARIYLVGNRLYQVIIVGRASKVTAGELGDYVDSFELLRKVAVAAPSMPPAPDAANAPQAVQAQPSAPPAPTASIGQPGPPPAAPAAEPEARLGAARPRPPNSGGVEVPDGGSPAHGGAIGEDHHAVPDDYGGPARGGADRTAQAPSPKPSNTRPAPPTAQKRVTHAGDARPDRRNEAEFAIAAKAVPRFTDRPEPSGDERERFRDVAKQGGVLVGARVGYINAFGGPKIGVIQPIFQLNRVYVSGKRYGRNIPAPVRIVARPGYAVGAINTRTGLLLDAFQLVFMKLKDGQLDPQNSYTSDWLGDPRGGVDGYATGDGNLVVGIHGRSTGREVNMLGLVVAE
jgi:hypothetical protein